MINDACIHQLTIDAATDVPCISHETLWREQIHPVPASSINLRSADGSTLKTFGYIRFNLTEGNDNVPVEALILLHLGSNRMQILM